MLTKSKNASNRRLKLRDNNKRDLWNFAPPPVWLGLELLSGKRKRLTRFWGLSMVRSRRVSIPRTSCRQKLFWRSCVESLPFTHTRVRFPVVVCAPPVTAQRVTSDIPGSVANVLLSRRDDLTPNAVCTQACFSNPQSLGSNET